MSFESLVYEADFPGVKSESGKVGNGSFGISFGYTGSYIAKPYGLVEAQEFSGTFSDSDFTPSNIYIKDLIIDVPEGTVLIRVKLPSNPGFELQRFYMHDPSAHRYISRKRKKIFFILWL